VNRDSGLAYRMTSRQVAVKCIMKERIRKMQRSSGALNENPLKEIMAMQYITQRMTGTVPCPQLRGDPSRVLPIIECLEDRDHFYIIMPCLDDEMFMVVEQNGGPFPEPQAYLYLQQMLDGLEVLHSMGLAHHDMSLENMMLDADGKCVIIDYGMIVKAPMQADGTVVKLAPARGWPGRCGKMLYLAPEILNPRVSFDPLALDMWSVGVMMFVLLTGVPPWDVETGPSPTDRRYQLVRDGRLHELLAAWSITHLSAEAVNLIQQMLSADPDRRLNIAGVRSHPWYQLRAAEANAPAMDEPH